MDKMNYGGLDERYPRSPYETVEDSMVEYKTLLKLKLFYIRSRFLQRLESPLKSDSSKLAWIDKYKVVKHTSPFYSPGLRGVHSQHISNGGLFKDLEFNVESGYGYGSGSGSASTPLHSTNSHLFHDTQTTQDLRKWVQDEQEDRAQDH